jgi:glutamyl-tRNA synthetase
MSGLAWLGLTWDEGPFYQTQRTDFYRRDIQTLLDRGLAYRCYCTPEELEVMREQQKARKEAPRYDNRHRNLTPEQRAEFEDQGRTAVIRFKIEDDREIVWQDLIRGTVTWKGGDLGGDMVIARTPENGQEAFGAPLYNLAVVTDDIEMQITHVIRGEDHIANTAKQILLYEALEAKVPEFAHTPLILNLEGRKLSKRDGVTSIDDFKRMGFIPQAMANYMTLLGWTPPEGEEIFTLAQAAEQFNIEKVNKAGAKFDWAKLDWINSQYLHKMPVGELLELLIPHWQQAGYNLDEIKDRPWLEQLTAMIAPNLTRLTDAVEESHLLFGETREFSEEAISQLKQEGVREIIQEVITSITEKSELAATDAQEIISQITKTQKVKKGVVMRSLRAGLMGELSGPDLLQSWLLLNQKGWDKTRLHKALEIRC